MTSRKTVLIGASTGGPGIIEKLISALPDHYPHPICIIQHFPAELTHSFVARLQTCTSNRVLESSHGLKLEKAMIVVGHGGVHIGFTSDSAGNLFIRHASHGVRNDFVPSVDEMMLSASEEITPTSILAILLTGIGDDGARGMAKITSLGGMSICQDERSSPVFGMPARAIERGGAKLILPPEAIIQVIQGFGE